MRGCSSAGGRASSSHQDVAQRRENTTGGAMAYKGPSQGASQPRYKEAGPAASGMTRGCHV